MKDEIQNAIDELNTNVSNLIQQNNKEIEEIKMSMTKSNAMPLSGNADNKVYVKSEFDDYVRKGMTDFLKKSLNSMDGENGGYLIPQDAAVQIDDKIKYLSPMRNIARNICISTNAIEIIVDSKMPDAGWSGDENEELLETDTPEISKIQIPVHEIYAKPKVSQKLLDDSQINAEEWLTSKIAEKIAVLENQAFVNGNGKDKPHGFLQCESSDEEVRPFGTLQHFYSGAKGKFADNESAVNVLIDMACSISPKYVKNAKWIMSRSALAEIRKLKNKDGVSLWNPAMSEATPSTLLGYPVIIDDAMPALVDGEESISVAFGDFYAGYQIVDRQGLKILRDPYTSKPFVEFYITKRTGGEVVDFEAIKLLKFTEKSE